MHGLEGESAVGLPHAPANARTSPYVRALVVWEARDSLLAGVAWHPDILELVLAARRPRR